MWPEFCRITEENPKFKGYYPGIDIISGFWITSIDPVHEPDNWKYEAGINNFLTDKHVYDAISDSMFLQLFKSKSIPELCIKCELSGINGSKGIHAMFQKMVKAIWSVESCQVKNLESFKKYKDDSIGESMNSIATGSPGLKHAKWENQRPANSYCNAET